MEALWEQPAPTVQLPSLPVPLTLRMMFTVQIISDCFLKTPRIPCADKLYTVSTWRPTTAFCFSQGVSDFFVWGKQGVLMCNQCGKSVLCMKYPELTCIHKGRQSQSLDDNSLCVWRKSLSMLHHPLLFIMLNGLQKLCVRLDTTI